ncbi:pyridoxal phosphate-dependent aminotransferase [Texcoconibacillus texcoconensis]|uniref:Aminotransferase n=1 Tax=Texcoconibacillus texcoconensis TaxID=1095777 RepID=A0A840QQ87_9BACI|nr:pyridoxal phosphate-dependent aminotransferase [Texcoconibacillus texcoconensis]MBB5173586.1 aspartate aminotransferase [Texcoconibacillus texcoconensis]
MNISKRVEQITPSSTLAITAKAKQLKQEGHDVIGLGAGEPDFNTPSYIIEAAYKSMLEGHTKYTPAGGMQSLKEAIQQKLQNDQQLSYSTDELIVTAGAKHALSLLFQALLNEGDKVVIPAPYWVSYPEQVKVAGGVPVIVESKEENEFKVTPEQLEASIDERTKAFILNSPSNPTGVVYSKEEIKALAEICLKHDIVIVSDEIYEKLMYQSTVHVSPAQLSEQVRNQTVIINGVSKSHSMTGWRIGFAAGNQALIKGMSNLASHTTSNPAVMAQYGALAAYQENDDAVEEMRQSFEGRLEKSFERLQQIDGVECVKPQGAFYLFPNVRKAVESGGFTDVDEWAKTLLEEEKVAVVPGSGFGAPDNVRLSYATSLEQVEAALDRIERFIQKHKK